MEYVISLLCALGTTDCAQSVYILKPYLHPCNHTSNAEIMLSFYQIQQLGARKSSGIGLTVLRTERLIITA